MWQILKGSQLGMTLAILPVAIAVMWWLGVWRTRRVFCYTVLAYVAISSLGQDIINWVVGASSHRMAYNAIWSAGILFAFVWSVRRLETGSLASAAGSSQPDVRQS